MERIPEPAIFATAAAAEEYARIDHGAVNAAFVETLVRLGCCRGEVLDLGTGPADIPLLLVERVADVQVTATDLSEDMVRIGRLKVAHAGQSRRIRLMHADASRLPFADRHFDGAFGNSLLHHLEDPVAVLRESLRVLKAGAPLVLRDLIRPATMDDVEALVALHAADATVQQQDMLRASLRAAYSLEELRELLQQAGIADAEIERCSDRHITTWVTAP